MKTEFANGLLGHRVEAKVNVKSPLQILTIIDKVNVGDTDSDEGRRFAINTDMYVVMTDEGMVDTLYPSSIVRVILPVNEPRFPTNDFERVIFGMQDVTKGVILMAKKRAAYLKAQKEGNEPQKSAYRYSTDTLKDRIRLWREVLMPNGFKLTNGTEEMGSSFFQFTKDGYEGMISCREVSLIEPNGSYRSGINIPLNEWVKNPTIEALMPKP
jgi:hypothetical protein